MAVILFSDFLKATGLGIISSIWQAAIVWTIVLMITKGRRSTAAERYTIHSVAQFLILAVFLSTIVYFLYRPVIANSDRDVTNTSDVAIVLNNWMLIVLPYLALAYFFIQFLIVFRWVKSFTKTQKIRDVPNELFLESIQSFIHQNAVMMGLKRKIEIIISHKVKSAVTIGMLKPVILLPLAAVNRLSAEQMEAVLIHELAHIKRDDYFTNLLHSFIEQLLFFNPFVRMISEKIKIERENACDDIVMLKQYKPAVYADALLKLARFSSNGFVMAAAKNGQPLLARVKRILHPHEQFDLSLKLRNLFFSLSLAVAAFFLLPGSVQQGVENHVIHEETPMPVQFASAVVENAPPSSKKKVQVDELAAAQDGNENSNNKAFELPVKRQKDRSTERIVKVESVNEILTTEAKVESVQAIPASANYRDTSDRYSFIVPAIYDEPVSKIPKFTLKTERTSFIIIVKEEEENKFSAHKSITVQVIANNGMIRTFQWNVDVYQ